MITWETYHAESEPSYIIRGVRRMGHGFAAAYKVRVRYGETIGVRIMLRLVKAQRWLEAQVAPPKLERCYCSECNPNGVRVFR